MLRKVLVGVFLFLTNPGVAGIAVGQVVFVAVVDRAPSLAFAVVVIVCLSVRKQRLENGLQNLVDRMTREIEADDG